MKNKTIKKHRNLEMNSDTYKLRRKVIAIIYEAKRLVNTLPRIDVRITECEDRHTLGAARMLDRIIWIPKTTTGRDCLRQVVLHEILHAVYGIKHNEKCKLMCPQIVKITREEEDNLFKSLAKQKEVVL